MHRNISNHIALLVIIIIIVLFAVMLMISTELIQSSLAAADQEPALFIPSQIPALPDSIVDIPISFTAGGNAIASIVFSIDYDQQYLTFDSSVPNSITFNVPADFVSYCVEDLPDQDGELDCFIYDPGPPPLAALPDGEIANIMLKTVNHPGTIEAFVNFSSDSPAASFGNTQGQSVPGAATNGSVVIQTTLPTGTPTSTRTQTPTGTNTSTPSGTPTDTPTLTETPTSTLTPTKTTTGTQSATVTPTRTGTPTITSTPTATTTGTQTLNPTGTPTPTQTSPVPQNYSLFLPITIRARFCYDAIVNGGFEDSSGWIKLPSAFPADYTSNPVHRGQRALRTGITFSDDNIFSYSEINQGLAINCYAQSVKLKVWLYTHSTQPDLLTSNPLLNKVQFPNTTQAGDAQFIKIVARDEPNIHYLYYDLENTNSWVYHEYDLSEYDLCGYHYIHFGAFNDGTGGVTAMFVDDVELLICK